MNETNKTTNNPNNMIQQQFHKSMFSRNRSNSLPSVAASKTSNKQSQNNELEPKNNDKIPLNPWQNDQVPLKRQKRKKTSPICRDNTKKSKNTPTFAVPTTHNKFDILNSEETEEPV
ncbi:unnamed protein product [Pieris macdunnoughi]|uniref:Uncharacterized protein n=1 Tax=Pieris macdunnoughi TaxID=345717 RepID=A0A821Y3P4_9NEOP|nr:unnamed protein product [Pieris macdunnoughi]